MKTVKKIICITLCIASVFVFAACGKEQKAAMTLEDCAVGEEAYRYWVSTYKAQFMNQYSDMSDTDEFWNQEISSGVTAEDFLTELVNEYVKMNLVSIYLFDEYGLKISSEDKQAASDIISDFREISGGSKKALETILSEYGVNEKTLKQIYLDEFKTTYVYNYVFENGVLSVGDSEKQNFLNDNYVRIRHIYINNSYDYDKSYYDADGNFIKTSLSDSAKAEKDRKVEKVRAALANGDDFDSVYNLYSEETSYKNGYYICNKTEDLPDELILNSFKLEIGESMEFETEYGTHFIRRLEMDEGAWKSSANEDFFQTFSDDVYESVFTDFIKSYFEKITVNDDIVKLYPVRDALPNWSYQY